MGERFPPVRPSARARRNTKNSQRMRNAITAMMAEKAPLVRPSSQKRRLDVTAASTRKAITVDHRRAPSSHS